MTIYSLDTLVSEAAKVLAAREVPINVRLGRHRYIQSITTGNEVIFREREGGDDFSPRITHGPRAERNVLERSVSVIAEIRARSTIANTDENGHRRLVTDYMHAVIAALFIAGETNGIPPTFESGGFVDDEKTENEFGAVYELRFSVPEVVRDKKWDTASGVEWGGQFVLNVDGHETEA